jgi:hypothetical protein
MIAAWKTVFIFHSSKLFLSCFFKLFYNIFFTSVYFNTYKKIIITFVPENKCKKVHLFSGV